MKRTLVIFTLMGTRKLRFLKGVEISYKALSFLMKKVFQDSLNSNNLISKSLLTLLVARFV